MTYGSSRKKDSRIKRIKRSKKSEERQTKQERAVAIRSLDVLYIEKLSDFIIDSNTIIQTHLGPVRLL
jgi:hypothetical protein